MWLNNDSNQVTLSTKNIRSHDMICWAIDDQSQTKIIQTNQSQPSNKVLGVEGIK